MERPLSKIIPKTLLDWRRSETFSPWDALREWFAGQGLMLYTSGVEGDPYKDFSPRPPDGIVYAAPCSPPRLEQFQLRRVHRFARTLGGQIVLIRIIRKGPDGMEELSILRKIASGHQAMLGENHALPMLRELELEDMTFGVFPAVSSRFHVPWFENADQAFDAIIQILEGFAYLHRNLIAHRDIDGENVLFNAAEGTRRRRLEDGSTTSFRSTFPIRYYIIDFELSVMFNPDSKPENRLVTGLPASKYGSDHPDDYGRDLAPEVITQTWHNPFKADVFQLGAMFCGYFRYMRQDFPQIMSIFDAMKSSNPDLRPTVEQALASIRSIYRCLTRGQLDVTFPKSEPDDISNPTERAEASFARWEARDAARRAAEAAEFSRDHPLQDPLWFLVGLPYLILGVAAAMQQ